MNSWTKAILALLLCGTGSVALANANDQAMQFQDIREQQARLQAEVRAGRGAFKDMDAAQRQDLLSRQTRLLALLQGRQGIDDFPPEAKLELFNLLEYIKGAVTRAEDDRMVCRRERVVGSNLPQVVCMTAKAERERRERTRDVLLQGRTCASSECVLPGPAP